MKANRSFIMIFIKKILNLSHKLVNISLNKIVIGQLISFILNKKPIEKSIGSLSL